MFILFCFEIEQVLLFYKILQNYNITKKKKKKEE